MIESYVYGIHAVSALLTKERRATKKLCINEERMDHRLQSLLEMAVSRQIPIERLSLSVMSQRFPDVLHQGVVAYAEPLPSYVESDLESLWESCSRSSLILVLDGITDPHNLGACLRSADAAGVDFVVIPKDKSVGVTPVVSKVACGAAESVPLVRVTNLARAMDVLKALGVWIYGAMGEASTSLYTLDMTGSVALVLGAEGKGLRQLTQARCDGLFSLPMLGTVTSLNVSVATGICLYEVVRQRSF